MIRGVRVDDRQKGTSTMTFKSRLWRYKKLKRTRVIRKIHNSILRGITGLMSVFFLLALCSIDNVNIYVIIGYIVSFVWLSLIIIANNIEENDND